MGPSFHQKKPSLAGSQKSNNTIRKIEETDSSPYHNSEAPNFVPNMQPMSAEQIRAIALEKIMKQNAMDQLQESERDQEPSVSSYYDSEEENSVKNDPQRRIIDKPINLADPQESSENQHREYQSSQDQFNIFDVQTQQ